MTQENNKNPYVGPRPFMRGEADRFFGREREARELQALILSNRLVLFYARSGAGKSSLLNARLIPGLEAKGFEVLPVARVTGGTSFDVTETGTLSAAEVNNPYLYNLMLSLDQSGRALPRFTHPNLAEFLINLVNDDNRYLYVPEETPPEVVPSNQDQQADAPAIWPRALIIDQFEEILTSHLEAWDRRSEFFTELASAMEADPYLWVVLTMREDHVAGLDPYAHLLPGRLRTRYYMQRMDAEAAREAIAAPAAAHGRPFEQGVAAELVDNLRQVRTGGGPSHLGPSVEPVQLQVVCFQLWENLRSRPLGPITSKDLSELGNVDSTLAQFYEEALQTVLAQTTVSEALLRHWFERELITEAGTRGLVYQGANHTGSLPNEAVHLLANKYLIRAERRAGGVWYELVHDRFVGPILESNRTWQAQQAPLFRAAKAWESADRDQKLLYRGTLLEETLATVETASLEPLVQEFLRASQSVERQRELAAAQARAQEEQERAETEARSARRLRILAGSLLLAAGGLLLALLVVAVATYLAITQANAARNNEAIALAEATRASGALAAAQVAEAEASTAQALSVANEANALSQATSAAESASAAQTAEAEAELRAEQARQNVDVAVATSVAQQQIITEQQLELTAVVETFVPQVQGESETLFTVTPVPTRTPTPAPDATPTPQPSIRRRPIGRSVLGEQLNIVSIGQGPTHLVLIGGIHAGFAPGTVELAREIRSLLEESPQLIPSDVTVDILESLNPDSFGLDSNRADQIVQQAPLSGSLEGRLNANGVDLNRNWECDWLEDATWNGFVVPGSGGSAPLSEPESRALNRFLESITRTAQERIGAVVIWQASAVNGLVSPGACGEESQVSSAIAETYAEAAGYNMSDYTALTGNTVNGDLANSLDREGVPAVSVLLPSYDNPDLEPALAALKQLLEALSR
ncbi:MAG: M14 family zinc carboxypeptidase [Candidatus Promineifilaceae bacterium]|nr:M14 family zinc carboxypeptidase [Candidatus Promineifilaceae bacterium]